MPHAPSPRPAGAADTELSNRLIPLVERAIARAEATGRSVLLTASEAIQAVDPLDAIEDGVAPQMYWAVPREDFAVVGLGAVATLSGSGQTRFADVGRAWARLRQEAIVEDSQPSLLSGPMLMGGFSFDPDGPRSGTWAGFPAASYVVPSVLVTRRGDESRLRLSALVDGETDPDTLVAELEAERDRVMARAAVPRSAAALQGALSIETDASADAAWRRTVAVAAEAIRHGEMEKVVLARGVNLRLPARKDTFDAPTALRHLRATQPAAFVFGIWRDDAVLLGATPERLVCLRGRDIETSALAGSAPRGSTAAGDARASSALRASAKDREEHEIVRRDIHRALENVCEGVTSPLEPSVLTLPAMHHLHTAVRARLAPGKTVFDVVEQLHPTPALGGAPRNVALRFIAEHEDLDRGWYAAPIGWVTGEQAEFAVVLRAALVRGPNAAVFAGCGIVAQSDPDAEFAESSLKLTTALNAVAAGARGRSA